MNSSGRTYIFWVSCLILATVLQLVAGNFPYYFFKFPLNVIVSALWIYGIWILYKDYGKSGVSRLLLSPASTYFTISSLICGALVIGLFPQLSAAEAESRTGFLARLGVYDFMSSWIFVGILFMLLTHLGMITVRAFFRRKRHRWRFILNHAGIWLAVWGGFMGSSDLQNIRIPVFTDEANSIAYTMDGETVYLDYSLRLKDFEAEHYENGMPRSYEATVSIIEGDDVSDVLLRVNHPYQKGLGEDVYLTGYDTSGNTPGYCVIQIVRQPWKYVQLLGIIMALAGAVGMFIGGPHKIKEEDDQLG